MTDDKQVQAQGDAKAEGKDDHEYPFLKKLAEAFKGQGQDFYHDIVDPIKRLRAMSKALSELADKKEAEQKAKGGAGAEADGKGAGAGADADGKSAHAGGEASGQDKPNPAA